MDITVVKGGKFTFNIKTEQLSKGLRKTKRNTRNDDSLVTCSGFVGKDGVLQALESLTRMATSTITDGFPFPQIFVFTNVIIVCGLKKIYEWDGTSLDLKYTAAEAGGTWSAVDFFNYIYMSNGKIAVTKDAGSRVYSLSATQPTATAICNYNGQIVIGAPDVEGLGASMVLPTSPLEVAVTQLGTMVTS